MKIKVLMLIGVTVSVHMIYGMQEEKKELRRSLEITGKEQEQREISVHLFEPIKPFHQIDEPQNGSQSRSLSMGECETCKRGVGASECRLIAKSCRHRFLLCFNCISTRGCKASCPLCPVINDDELEE